ncbi:MAG: DUF5911 domain-containing protein [Alphaproteobacteria bacterium]|nr:DUF5911 domain-containing protein [Alphaproteobacteria bacterium]
MTERPTNDLDLAVIGNCAFGALIDSRARIVWACLPRFDGDPVFCSLLNGTGNGEKFGFYDIELTDFDRSEQTYVRNTAILLTTLYDRRGSAVEITDFAPRFTQFDRVHRPDTIIRHIRPLRGNPQIRIRLRPAFGYGAGRPDVTRGSNHIRYLLSHMAVRLTTNAPISYILDETSFILEEDITLFLGPDESLTKPIRETGRDFYERTHDYWREWTRYLAIPFEWQEAVIRAAITLKLCTFEETGAVVAALTTSIPEAPNSGRNWDYRYCWLRDAYFVVQALNRLGATRSMEEYLRYITNIVAASEDGHLQPVYGIGNEAALVERQVDGLAGYRAMGPVRVGNQAYEHVQNDVYGSVVMAATQWFFDERLVRPGNERLFERLERVGEQALKLYDQPDAGIWEFRSFGRVHTHSSVMCWAACDRLAKIARRIGLAERGDYWRGHAEEMHKTICARAWNADLNSFVASFDGAEIDASLLLLHELGFLSAGDPRFIGTVEAVEKKLRRGNYLMRYVDDDDFGAPENAFNICTFWYIEALDAIGRKKEARALFENMLARRNRHGLLSEDLDPSTDELWGNFPQTYSMVGLISSAMRLSRTWEAAF